MRIKSLWVGKYTYFNTLYCVINAIKLIFQSFPLFDHQEQ